MSAGFALPGRSRQPERMDEEPVAFEDFAACLRDLERVNRLSLGYRPTLDWLDRVAAGRRRLSLLDVGSGGGDMLRRVWAWSRKRGVEVELTGVDLNCHATRAAREATPAEAPIRFETGDAFDIGAGRRFDVIVSALFAHHLDDAGLLRFVRWMDRTARLGWFVNDLHRCALPRRFLQGAFALAPVHRFVRHDGPVSVARAFTRAELEALLAAAEVPHERTELRWRFPFRWGLGVRRS